MYVGDNLPREASGRVWREVFPEATLVVEGEQDVLSAVAPDRIRHSYTDGVSVLHLVTGRKAQRSAAPSRPPFPAAKA